MRTMTCLKRPGGFTLIELLVAVSLMVILITAIAMIFHHTTDIVKVSEARIAVYSNARAALDWIQKDMSGILPVAGGQQAFGLAQNFLPSNGGPAGPPGNNGETMIAGPPPIAGATDAMVFNATTMVAGSVQAKRILYCLDRESDWSTQTGAAAGINVTVKTGRPLFALVRRVYPLPSPAAPAFTGNSVPSPSDPPSPPCPATPCPHVPRPCERGALCEYVLSFNIEVFSRGGSFAFPGAANTARYWQLDMGGYPFANSSGNIGSSPYLIGDTAAPVAGECLPRALRITMRVTDGSAERTERLVSRVVWIPMSP